MQRQFTESEAARHNSLVEHAWKLTKGHMILEGDEPARRPGWFARRRLNEAMRLFEQALGINSEGWSSMWALGKIQQRLGNHQASLDWFARAQKINPSHPDVAREAGLAALDCGEAELAVQLCSCAVDNRPGDAGLVANLALAHLLNSDDKHAIECAESAARAAPGDETSRTVLEFVRDVADGRRPRPKKLLDAFPD
jgi:tetratricopeptide (TPR) repeat protein